MKPRIIKGNSFSDSRGTLTYNNSFDASEIKRIYTLTNHEVIFKRGWQGHKIEQRWFSAISGSFQIKTAAIDNWEQPLKELEILSFNVYSKNLDVLHIPSGYITLITALEEDSKLLAMSDHFLGEVNDECRYDIDHFNSF